MGRPTKQKPGTKDPPKDPPKAAPTADDTKSAKTPPAAAVTPEVPTAEAARLAEWRRGMAAKGNQSEEAPATEPVTTAEACARRGGND